MANLRHVVVIAVVACLVATSCRSEPEDTELFADPSSDEAATPISDESGSSAGGGDRRLARSGDRAAAGPIDLAPIALDEWTMTEEDAEEVLAFYGDFLALSDAALLGDEGAADELDLILDPLIRYLAEDWQSRNEQLAAQGLSIIDRSSEPNIISLTGSADGAVVHDCVVQQITDEFTQTTRTEHVEQITVLRQTSGLWLVSLVEILHTGNLDSGPVRCVSYAERGSAEVVLVATLDGLSSAWADPEAGVDHLAGVIGADFLERVDDEIGTMVAEGVYADGEQNHSVEVIGAYLLGDDTSYLVTSCTDFPTGLIRRSAATGEPIDVGESEASAPVTGTVYREWTVANEPGDDGEDRLVVTTLDVQRVGSSCDDGSVE